MGYFQFKNGLIYMKLLITGIWEEERGEDEQGKG